MDNFPTRMRALRLERKLTQERLADLAGYSYKHVQWVERGKVKNITLVFATCIAKALDVPLSELLDE